MREAYSVQIHRDPRPRGGVSAHLWTWKISGLLSRMRNYGRRWSCPPFEFDPLELWNRYDTLHLYACARPAPGADTDGLLGA